MRLKKKLGVRSFDELLLEVPPLYISWCEPPARFPVRCVKAEAGAECVKADAQPVFNCNFPSLSFEF